MKTGVELIAEERARQIAVEGYTSTHDDGHPHGELALAGACYAIPPEFRTVPGIVMFIWPWEDESFKPTPDRILELAKAGALIAAEIDRLQRAKGKASA